MQEDSGPGTCPTKGPIMVIDAPEFSGSNGITVAKVFRHLNLNLNNTSSNWSKTFISKLPESFWRLDIETSGQLYKIYKNHNNSIQ